MAGAEGLHDKGEELHGRSDGPRTEADSLHGDAEMAGFPVGVGRLRAGDAGRPVRAGHQRVEEAVRPVGAPHLLPDDPGHLLWAAQLRPDGRLGPGVRVFRRGSATAVVSPGLSGRDRIAVGGAADDALVLVRDEVLAEVGPGYRPFGDAELIAALVRGIPGLVAAGGPGFLWMETAERLQPAVPEGVRWLDAEGEREAAALFEESFPGSYARPGRPGVRRWAGAYDQDPDGTGRLLAVAGDAWSGAGCGFMAGVVTRPEARGRGLGVAVSRFVVDALVREYGRAALMVDADNPAAIAVYRRAGMRGREFAAAARAWGSAGPS